MSRGKGYNNSMSRDGSISSTIKDKPLCNMIQNIAKCENKNTTTVVTELVRIGLSTKIEKMSIEEKASHFDELMNSRK